MSAVSSRRRFLLWLGGLWAVALAVRLVYLWEVSDSPLWLVKMGDARSYDLWARRLAAGDWLGGDVFYQAPLYPYFMGAVYATLGDGPWTLRVIQCLLGATGCTLLAVAGRRLAGRAAGLTAGLMLALYPPAIFFDGLIQKTTLTSFFLCALLAVIAGSTREPRSVSRWLAAGAVTGLLALVRENALVLALLAPAWVAFAFRRFGSRRFVWIAAFLAGVGVTLAPVAARNGLVGGEWHLTTSQFGPNFYIGNNAEADGLYAPLLPERGDPLFERTDAVSLAQEDARRPLTPREVSRYWTRRALGDIADDPAGWLRLLVRKLWLVYGALEIIDTEDQYTYSEYSRLLSSLMAVWHMGVLLPLGAFGAAALLPRRPWRRRLAWPALVILGYTASILLFFILGRYRFPVVPPLMLFAAAGLWETVRIARRRARRADRRPSTPTRRAVLARLSAALLLAAAVAVPVNAYPYRVEHAKAVTRENLGEHLYFTDLPKEMAVAEYERAIGLEPENPVLRANFAKVLWHLGRRDDAREQLETAAAQDPGDAVTLVELGLLLRDYGEYAASAERLRSAAASAPELPEPSYHLAVTLMKWADVLAASALGEAFDDPLPDPEGEAAANFERARSMRAEAVTLLRQSLALSPDSEGPHTALGHALASLGEREEAAKEFAAAAALAPPGSERQVRLRHLQRRLEGVPKARRSVRPAMRRK